MKNNGILAVLCAVFCIAFLTTCFTEWTGDQGSLSFSLKDNNPPDWVKEKKPQYTIILTGNGKSEIYGPYSYDAKVTLPVSPGTWDIEVVMEGTDWTEIETGSAEGVVVGTGVTAFALIQMNETTTWGKLRNAFRLVDKDKPFEIILDGVTSDPGIFKPVVLDAVGATVTFNGNGKTINVESGATGSLFVVKNGKLILKNITLKGATTDNNAPLVEVTGGELIMEKDSKIIGNYNTTVYSKNANTPAEIKERENSHGGGVRVIGGKFTMNDGVISDNHAIDGAGVKVNFNATFEMNGGEISNNHAKKILNPNTTDGTAGGVHVWEGSFIMKGGVIRANSAVKHGGGVYVAHGYFNKEGKTGGGIIYGNDAENAAYRNTVSSGLGGKYGYAVYVGELDPDKIRDDTVNETDVLSYNYDGGKNTTDGTWK